MNGRRDPPLPPSRGPSYRTRQERQPPPSSILGPPPRTSHGPPLYINDGDRTLSQQQEILSSEAVGTIAAGRLLAHALIAEALVGPGQPASHPPHRHNSTDVSYDYHSGEWRHGSNRRVPPMAVGSGSLSTQPLPVFHKYEPSVRTEPFLPVGQGALHSRERSASRSQGNPSNKVSIFDRPSNRSYEIPPPSQRDVATALHDFVTDTSSSRSERVSSSRSSTHYASTRSRVPDRDRGYSESYRDRTSSRVATVARKRRDGPLPSSSKYPQSSSRSDDHRSRKYSDSDRHSDRLEDRESRSRSPKRRRLTDTTSPLRSHSRPKSREGRGLHTLSDKQEHLLDVRQDIDVSLPSRSPVEARLGPPPAVTDRLGPAPDTSVQSRLGPMVPPVPELPDLRQEIEEKRKFEGHSRSTSISPSIEFLSNSMGSISAMSALQSDICRKIDTATLPSTSLPTSQSLHTSPTGKQPVQSPPSIVTAPSSSTSSNQINTTIPRDSTSANIPLPLIPHPSESQRSHSSVPPLLSIVSPTPTVSQTTSLPFDFSCSDQSTSTGSRLQVVETSKPDVYIVSDDEAELVIDVDASDKKCSASSLSPKEQLFVDTNQTPQLTTTSAAGLLSSKPSAVVSTFPLSKLSSIQLRSFTIPVLEKKIQMSPTSSHRSATPSSLLSQDSDSQSSQDQGPLLSSTLKTPKRANTVLGDSLVFLLDESTPSGSPTILARFFDAVIAIHRLCKMKMGSVCAFNYFVPYFQDVFKGFVTGILVERPLKPTALFERELANLLPICRNDVEKWKQQLNTYNLIAEALPRGKASVESFLIRHNLMPEIGSAKKRSSGTLISSTKTAECGSKSKPVTISKKNYEESKKEHKQNRSVFSRESVLASSKFGKSSDLLQTSKTEETIDRDSSCTFSCSLTNSSTSNKPSFVASKQSFLSKPSQPPSRVASVKPQTPSCTGTTDESLKGGAKTIVHTIANTKNQISDKLPTDVKHVSSSTQSPSSAASKKPQCPSSFSAQDKTTSKTRCSLGKKAIDHATTRAEKLAREVLSRRFVSELSQVQESSLLRELFESAVKIYGCIKWKRGNIFCWEYFIPYFRNVYSGFVVGELTDSTMPSTPTILFHKELSNLRNTCGTDLKKWQQRIQKYVSTTANLPKSKLDLPKFLRDNQHLVKHRRSINNLFTPSHSSDTVFPLTKDTDVQVTMFVPLSGESQKDQPVEGREKTPNKQPSTSVVMQSPTPTQHTYSSTPTIRSPLPAAKLNLHQQSAFSIVTPVTKPSQVETAAGPSITALDEPQVHCMIYSLDTTETDNAPLLSKTTIPPPLKPGAPSQQSGKTAPLVYSQQSGSCKAESRTQHSEVINTGTPSKHSEAINTGTPSQHSEAINIGTPSQHSESSEVLSPSLKLTFSEGQCRERDQDDPPPSSDSDGSVRSTPTQFMIIDSYDSQEAQSDTDEYTHSRTETEEKLMSNVNFDFARGEPGVEMMSDTINERLILESNSKGTKETHHSSNSTSLYDAMLTKINPVVTADSGIETVGSVLKPPPASVSPIKCHDVYIPTTLNTSSGEIVGPSSSNQEVQHEENASLSPGEIVSPSPSNQEAQHEENASLSPGEIVSPSPSSQELKQGDSASLSPGEIVSSSPSPSPTLAQKIAAKNLSSERRAIYDSEPPSSHFHYMYHSHSSYMVHAGRPHSPPPKQRSAGQRSKLHYLHRLSRRPSKYRERSLSDGWRSSSRDRRSRSRDRRSRSHDRRSRSRGRRSRSHDRRSRSRVRWSRSRDRRSRSRDRRSRSRDRRSRSRDRRSRSRDRRSRSRDKRSRSHDKRSRSHDRSSSCEGRPRSQEYHKSRRSRSHERQRNRPRMRSLNSNSPSNSEESELEILELKRKAIMSMIQKEHTSTTHPQLSQEHATPTTSTTVDNVPTSIKSDLLHPLITQADLSSGTGEGGMVDMDICSTSSVDSDQSDKKSPSAMEENVTVDDGGRGVSVDQHRESLLEMEKHGKEQSSVASRGCGTLADSEEGSRQKVHAPAVKVDLIVNKEKDVLVNVVGRIKVSRSLGSGGVLSDGSEPGQVSASGKVVKKKESSPSLSIRDMKTSQSSSSRTSTLSPALSPSPIPSPPGQCLIPKPGGSQARKSQSVKIYPSKKETWDIQPFHIVSSGVDSDSDRECIDDQPNEPMSDISKLLHEVRKAAEVSAKTVPKDRTSSHQILPSPIAALPPAKRKEYIILQKQLALHKKKKKGKVRSNSSPQIQAIKTKVPNSSSLVTGGDKQCARGSVVETSSKLGKHSRSPNAVAQQPLSKKALIEDTQSETVRQQSRQETASSGTTVIKHRRMMEYGQQRLTILTNQLTETVSEIEELELKMELYTKHIARLKKQLEVTREQHSKAEEKRQDLQNEVRSIKETMTQHNRYIQEAELKINANNRDGVDGTKGVASYPGGFSPLQYENISDSESVSANNQLQGQQLLKSVDYETISNVSSPAPIESPQPSEHSSKPFMDNTHQLTSPSLEHHRPSLNVEPVSDPEDTASRHPSPVVVELVSDCEQLVSESGKDLPTETEAVTDEEETDDKKQSIRDEMRAVDEISKEHNYSNQSSASSHLLPVGEPNQAVKDHQSFLSSSVPTMKEHSSSVGHSLCYEVEIPAVVISDHRSSMLSQLKEGGSPDWKALEIVKRSLNTSQATLVSQDVTQDTPKSHDTAQKVANASCDVSLQSHMTSHEDATLASHDTSSKSHDLPGDAFKPALTSESPSVVTKKSKKKAKKSITCSRTVPYNRPHSSASRKSVAGSVGDKSRKTVKKTGKKTVPKKLQDKDHNLFNLTGRGLLDRVMHSTLSTTLNSVVSQHSSTEHTSTSCSVPHSAHTHRVEDILSALVTSLNQANICTSVSSSISPEPVPSETLPRSPSESTPLADLTPEPDSLSRITTPIVAEPPVFCLDMLTTLDDLDPMLVDRQEELDYSGFMCIDPSIIFHPGTNDLFELSSSVPPLFKCLPRQEWACDLPLEIDPQPFEECVLNSVRDGLIIASAQKTDSDSSQSTLMTEHQQQEVNVLRDTIEKDKPTLPLKKLSTTHQQVATTALSQTKASTGKPVKSANAVKSSQKQADAVSSKAPIVKPLLPGSSGNITAAKIQVVQDQLQRKIKELKGQLAAKSSSGRNSPVESTTLSDKSSISTKSHPPPSQLKATSSGVKRSTPVLATTVKSKAGSSSSFIVKTTGAADAVKDICKLLGREDVRQLDQLQKLYESRECKIFSGSWIKRGEERMDLLSITFCSVGPLSSFSGTSPTVSDDVIAAIEQPVKEITSSLGSPPKAADRFYTSPLLAFKSYRLNPLYRTHEKLPLSSLSHSNKIDPHKIICKFELFGVCNNPECNAQHLRDVKLSKEEVVKDLVSYSPSLADCSDGDVAIMEQCQSSELQNTISEKLSVFASSLVQRYSSKVPDEDLYKVAVHEVNSEKNRTSKKGYVSFQDHLLQLNSSARREEQPISHAADLSHLDTAVVVGCGSDSKPRIHRYFTSDEAVQKISTSSDPVQQCLRAAQQNSGEEVVTILEAGLEQAPSSEELWVEYIRSKETEAVFDEDPSNPHLIELCFKAIQATSCSQAVVFECLRALGTYKEKQRVIHEAVKSLRECPLTENTSQQCLELMLNSVLLDLVSGRNQSAVRRIQLAFTTQSGEDQQHPFTDLVGSLTHNHCLVLSLCYINIVYTDQLPHSVFTMEDSFPARMVSLHMFTINWDKQRQLSHKDYKRILKLFRVCLEYCATGGESEDDQSSAEDIKQCLSLYLNLVLFEATHGDTQKAVMLLTKITTVSPQLTEAWILYSRVLKDKEAILKVLMEATQHCPHSCELYYLAARLELSFNTKDGGKKDEERDVQKAIEWLTLCVTKFFKLSSDHPLQPGDSLYLYRKLLGQMVPYNYQTPEYGDNVNLELTKQNITLWLCYCLMVELQQLSTPNQYIDDQKATSLVLQAREVALGSEFLHDSVEEAFESAIHSTFSPKGSRQLWREYLFYTRAKLISNGVREFKNLYSLVQRCLAAVESTQLYLLPLYGQPDTCQDYSYHNEVADLFLSILPSSSPLKLAVLQRFIKLLPANHMLVSRLVTCAVDLSKVELAQSVLANHLLEHPHSCLLWRMAVGLERRLRLPREARWLYWQAIKNLPLHFELWKDLLLFEVGQCVSSEGVSTASSLVSRVLRGAQHRDIDLTLKTILLQD